MKRWKRMVTALSFAGVASGAAACSSSEDAVKLHGQVQLTLLHTSDIHSRLFPYDYQINTIDANLGLGPSGVVARIGGAAKISHIIGRERARSGRALHLDGGDCFQGAPVFNFFNGEAEMRALSEMGTDAMIVANHEFDKGAYNLTQQIQSWGTFPVLAANYKFDDISIPGNPQLSKVIVPWTMLHADGLKVGVIGMGNLSSMTSLFEQPNSLGITPYNTIDVAQFYVDLIRPLVDVVVLVTHLGLEVDQEMISGTSGIDVVLGGHNHIVLQPPKILKDCEKVDDQGRHYIEILSGETQSNTERPKFNRRYCTPRNVILEHAGAFARYVGRLDLMLSDRPSDFDESYDPLNKFEVLSNEYRLIPVTEDVPEDPHVRSVLSPYKKGLDALLDLDLLVGYAPEEIIRSSPSGGDSALGNLVATAGWLRLGVQTDFAMTNTLGIRSNLVPGAVSIEQLYNIFPFDNSIAKMQLSGDEVQTLFDFAARRSASRGCATQVQIAGARVVINCSGCNRYPATDESCTREEDCTSSGPNSRCLAGKCSAAPCAEQIFIGKDTSAPCTADSDCPKQLHGSCDLSSLDSAKRGRCWFPLDEIASYELATSDYLAKGGSGFSVLKQNTTQFDTGIQQRDALIDYIRQGKPCGFDAAYPTQEGLKPCAEDVDCGDTAKFTCACVGHTTPTQTGACAFSADRGNCGGNGRCVLRACRDDLAAFHRRTCESARTNASKAACEVELNPCELAGEECKFLSCIDNKLPGSSIDNRLLMEGK